MMSNRFRILVLITLAVLAVSAIGSAFPLPSISLLFDSTRAGFAKPEVTRRPPANVAPPVRTDTDTKLKPGAQFTIYQDINGEFVCRTATTSERREMANPDLESLGMRPINHLDTVDKTRGIQPSAAPNLTIVLRATQQLQQNAAATAAFTRAAKNWEDIIKSPVTVYMDVDYGATRFGQPWSSGVLGQTGVESQSYPYQSVRTNLIAEANGEGNATKQSLFNALPGTTVPTDVGDANSTDVADPGARAIGLLPATAQSTDDAARIAFNSNFTFDFDPSDGITVGQTDFDAVATHEIGHALGFDSEAGSSLARPSVWDLYRFRTGVTNGTFTAAQRILTIGGSPDPLQFYFAPGNAELGLSTGGPTGASTNGGDGWQSSHWKHVNGCSPSYIGIMDPAIPSGCRRTITSNDILALSSFGYNLTNNNAPPPPPPPPPAPANDNFASGQTISSCSGSITGTNFSATSESGEPSHDPPDATSLSPSRSVWYQWQAPSSGSVTMTTTGSDFDTIIAVYSGSTLNVLSRIVFNDDVQDGVIRTSSVTFSATAGTVYQIAIDGWGSEQGGIKLNWTGCGAPSPTPTPTPTPSPTPSATPTATPVVSPFPTPTPLPPGRAVAYQIDPAHTGAQSDNLTPPLSQRWARDLGGFVSYPLIAEGRIFVTVSPAKLFALDEATGANLWGPIDLGGSAPWSGIAYDGGRVFAVNASGLLRAFDAASGAVLWSRQLPQTSFTSPPTAFGGLVYTAGSGVNGTLSAVSQQDGTIKWTAFVFTADHSSPAVSGTDVYVSYSCNLAYDFSPPTGTLLWRHTSSCLGGGGKTPVLFANRLYVRDSAGPNVVLNASNGSELGTFSASVAPAFSGSTGYFLSGSTLQARDVASAAVLWSFTGDGTLSSAPIIDNGYVYVGSTSGKLYALSANTGANVWTGIVGASVSAPDEHNASVPTTGLGAGDGLVVVPATNLLVAYQAAPPNPIDQAVFFVKQHYLDFLSRQPDQSGWDFWTNQITPCGTNLPCNEVRRIDVSASFFLSIEFQNNGYLVERVHKVAYGNATGNSTFGGVHQLSVPIVRFNEFLQGTQRIGQGVIVLAQGWEQLLESNKQAYALEFVQTSRFISAFPTNMTPTEFVDKLNANAGNVLSATERNTAINLFSGAANSSNTNSRAQAVRQVAEDTDLYNAEYNRAFVLAEYFGYLRRNPNDAPESTLDYTGYDFWLTKLNQFNGNYINAEMVKAFLSSIEYRQRFGP